MAPTSGPLPVCATLHPCAHTAPLPALTPDTGEVPHSLVSKLCFLLPLHRCALEKLMQLHNKAQSQRGATQRAWECLSDLLPPLRRCMHTLEPWDLGLAARALCELQLCDPATTQQLVAASWHQAPIMQPSTAANMLHSIAM